MLRVYPHMVEVAGDLDKADNIHQMTNSDIESN